MQGVLEQYVREVVSHCQCRGRPADTSTHESLRGKCAGSGTLGVDLYKLERSVQNIHHLNFPALQLQHTSNISHASHLTSIVRAGHHRFLHPSERQVGQGMARMGSGQHGQDMRHLEL